MSAGLRAHGASSPSPRLRGEGRGEGASPQAQTRPASSDSWRGPLTRNLREERANSDLSPQAGRREGRICPLDYFYAPAVFARRPDFAADTLYVAGGLYGNLAAARAIEQLAAAERRHVAIVYNGDFHWFDAEDDWFDAVERAVTPHRALRGNIETEIARSLDIGAGCGCAYPSAVADDVVMRSNLILGELRGIAARAPAARARVSGLPMHLVAEVGGLRVGVVHGDATSLAGWGLTRENLVAATSALLADVG